MVLNGQNIVYNGLNGLSNLCARNLIAYIHFHLLTWLILLLMATNERAWKQYKDSAVTTLWWCWNFVLTTFCRQALNDYHHAS